MVEECKPLILKRRKKERQDGMDEAKMTASNKERLRKGWLKVKVRGKRRVEKEKGWREEIRVVQKRGGCEIRERAAATKQTEVKEDRGKVIISTMEK